MLPPSTPCVNGHGNGIELIPGDACFTLLCFGPMVEDPLSCPVSFHPSLSEALVNSSINVFDVQWDSCMRLLPGHCGKKSNHHLISSFASCVSGIQWCNFSTDILRSISLYRKILPDGTILHAKESLPIRERSSHVLHLRHQHHWLNSTNKASLR